jgi:hypothetical protein
MNWPTDQTEKTENIAPTTKEFSVPKLIFMCYSFLDTHTGSYDSSVGTVTRQWAGWSWVRFLAQESLSVLQNVQTDAAATRPPIQWVVGVLSLEVKQPELEADHSIPSCAQVMNESSHIPIPPQPAQGQLYLYVRHAFCNICCVQAVTYFNRRFQWQKLFCKYNEFNYQHLKECWII